MTPVQTNWGFFMLLELEDGRVRIRLSSVIGNKLRLVMDVPREKIYRERILTALADFLRPGAPLPDDMSEDDLTRRSSELEEGGSGEAEDV